MAAEQQVKHAGVVNVWWSNGEWRVRISHLGGERRSEARACAAGLTQLERIGYDVEREAQAVAQAVTYPTQLPGVLRDLRIRYRQETTAPDVAASSWGEGGIDEDDAEEELDEAALIYPEAQA